MCYLPSKSGILSAAPVTIWPALTIGDSLRISPSPGSPPGILRIFFINTYGTQYIKQIYAQYQNSHSPYNLNGKYTNQLVSRTPVFTKQMQYFLNQSSLMEKYLSFHSNISGIVLFIGIFTVLYIYIEFVIF